MTANSNGILSVLSLPDQTCECMSRVDQELSLCDGERGNSNARVRPCGPLTAVGSSESLPIRIYTSCI